MSSRKKQRIPLTTEASSTPLNSAFARLAAQLPKSTLPEFSPDADGKKIEAPKTTIDERLDEALKNLRRPHAFKTRKGRGGKTVTEVGNLTGLDAPCVALLCRRLCRKLGCGGSVLDQVIVLQGDKVQDVVSFFKSAQRH